MGVKAGLIRVFKEAARRFEDSASTAKREGIAFFIEYCEAYRSRVSALESDGDGEDEVRQSMILYEPQLIKMASMSIYQHLFDPHKRKELKIDNVTDSARSDLFFGCVKYADSNPRIYGRMKKDRLGLVRDFIRLFGKPYNASELALKAETAGDSGLATLLEG